MKIKITLLAILLNFITFSQTVWEDLGTFNNFPTTIESQLKIKENGKPVFAYIDLSGDPSKVLIQEWTGTTWSTLPDLNTGYSSVYDLNLEINGNTMYLGVGDFGNGYSVFKFEGGFWNELSGGFVPGTGDFSPGTVRLSCGQDEDDLSLSYGTDGNEFRMFRWDGGSWIDSFGNEINMTMGSDYGAIHTDHVMFDNSDKTFVLMNQNQGNNPLMMYYANQTDDGAIIDSVRNGSDLAFLANNPGIIRIDGDPTTPNGPTIAYIGNDNEDFIEIKKINSSDPSQYIDIIGFGYQEPATDNFTEFDMAMDNADQINIAYITALNKNKALFFDGSNWIDLGTQIDASNSINDVDIEMFQASITPYVMYETPSGSGVKVFNTPAQFNSMATVTDLCETSSPSTTSILSNITFNDVNHDSLFIVSITSDNQAIMQNANLSATRTSAYDYNSPSNSFEIFGKPEANANGTVLITITVSDGYQNSMHSFNLTINSLPTVGAGLDQNVCQGSNVTLAGTGSATSYVWDNGIFDNTPFVANSDAIYTVTGTDANGCSNTSMTNVYLLATTIYTSSSTTEVTCNGMADGSIILNGLTATTNYDVDLGSGDITYTSDGSGTLTITGLSVGGYPVTVTDNTFSCTYTGSNEIINEPTVLSYANSFPTQTICENETINLDHLNAATGGTPSYTYSWDNGIINGVDYTPTVGSHIFTLTVVDANGCTDVETANVTVNTAPPTYSTNLFNPTSCGATDGYIKFTNLEATTNYDLTYEDPSVVGPNAITTNAAGEYQLNLGAGTYTDFIITNGNNCSTYLFGGIMLVDPAGPTVNTVSDQTICAGSDFSIINLTGTSGATFNWTNDNPSIGLASSGTGDIPSFTGLNSGSTTEIANITVTPTLGGCTGASETFTLTVNPLDDAGFTYSSNSFCEGDSDPSINVNVFGGVFNYSVVSGGPTLDLGLSNGSISISTSNSGVYDVTYSAGALCPNNTTQQISINALPTLTNTQPTIQYCAESGDISLDGLFIPVGGTYSGVGINNNFIGTNSTSAGSINYTYTYTDVNGCTNTDATGLLEILEIPNVQASTITNTTCGTNNGSITGVNIVGGLAPYTLYWSNGETTTDISNLEPRTYYLNITDGNNCYNMDVFTVSSFEITLSGNASDVSCKDSNDGSIDLTVSGSNGPYNYYWSNGATTEDINNLVAGQYEVFVSSADGCMSTMSFNVNEPTPLTTSFATTNPTSCGSADGIIVSNPLGGNGTYNYTWKDVTGINIGSTNTINALNTGTYSVEISDGNNCQITRHVSISDPTGPVITVNQIENSNCNSDGSINVNIDSPNSINSTTWSNGEITQNISGLASGIYSLIVEDNLGCQSSINTVVNENIPDFTEICIVTVDTNTNTNLVVWEKPISSDIDYFILYRESSVAGQYLVVDSINYSEESQFTDLVAYPQYRSWRYKLVTVNNCGIKSFKSPEHKTIHITYSEATPGTYNVSWDQYEGFSYSTFDLYRHTTANGWELIQTLPSTTFSYTDTPTSSDGIDYIISITPPSTCTSTGKAQDHNASRSNKSSNIAAPGGPVETDDSGVTELTNINFSIYPNPSSGLFNVSINTQSTNDYIVNIYDIKGSVVKTLSETNSTFIIDINEVENGSYFIEINTEDGVIRQHIIKN